MTPLGSEATCPPAGGRIQTFRKPIHSSNQLSAKSSQLGFVSSIKAIFFFLNYPFICFSLVIAIEISSVSSK